MAGLIFQAHVLAEMADDNITVDEVYLIVGDYDGIIEREVDGRTEYDRMMDDGRRLVVVIEYDGMTVVTAWEDRRRGKRRRRRWS